MWSKFSMARVAVLFAAVGLGGCGTPEITVQASAATDADKAKVVFLAGPDSHGPGAHEHQAGSELLSAALRERDAGYETINVYGG